MKLEYDKNQNEWMHRPLPLSLFFKMKPLDPSRKWLQISAGCIGAGENRKWLDGVPDQNTCHASACISMSVMQTWWRCTVGKWTSIEHSVDSWNMFHSYSCNYCQSNLFYRSSFKSAGCSETEIVGKKNDRLIQRSEYQSDINAPNAERWPSYSCKCSCFCLFVCVCNLQMAYSSMDLQEHDWNLVFCVCGVCFMSILVSVWM